MHTLQDSNLLTDVDLELHAEQNSKNTIQVKLHFAGKKVFLSQSSANYYTP